MKIYLVTNEWQISGDHEWNNFAFAKKEDAESFIKKDLKSVLSDMTSLDGVEVYDYSIDTPYDEWYRWSIEELEVQ